MIAAKSIIPVVLVLILFQNKVDGSNSVSQTNSEDSASIPVVASGKRMHNMMRFGKRPAGGDAYIEHEKRDGGSKPAQHSFLYFGKREDDQDNPLPDLVLQYLQDRARNASVKKNNGNQHNMMRFGKRSPDDDDQSDDYDEYSPLVDDIDEDKRGGHSMMYFGKRGGHNMMYFGKRTAGHNILSFGKRPVGHNMMSFGKRAAPGHTMMSFGKRAAPGHMMMSFGKRPVGHSMMSFGKRAHSMIHFGKREDGMEDEESKRGGGHAMFHFGKRDGDEDYDDDFLPEETKRAAHSMIHFGKREYEEDGPLPFFWNPAAEGLYRYGKKTGNKNNHAMIHFGKRSVDAATEKAISGNDTTVTRSKRDLETVESTEQLVPLLQYGGADEGDMDEVMETAIKQPPQTTIYYPDGIIDPLPYEVDPLLAIRPEYIPLFKKEPSKNLFMRFG